MITNKKRGQSDYRLSPIDHRLSRLVDAGASKRTHYEGSKKAKFIDILPFIIIKRQMSPNYEYICKNCEIKTIINHHIKTREIIKCDLCKNELIRTISMPSIQFKGSGFYSTDK